MPAAGMRKIHERSVKNESVQKGQSELCSVHFMHKKHQKNKMQFYSFIKPLFPDLSGLQNRNLFFHRPKGKRNSPFVSKKQHGWGGPCCVYEKSIACSHTTKKPGRVFLCKPGAQGRGRFNPTLTSTGRRAANVKAQHFFQIADLQHFGNIVKTPNRNC